MVPRRYLPITTAVAVMLAAMSVPAHAATIQILMENMVFSPAEPSARVGDTVEWTNKDIFVHTSTARNGTAQESRHPRFEEGWHHRLLLPLPT
jgi:plastocyanin